MPAHTTADALRAVADLIDGGVPKPLLIMCTGARPAVQVTDRDLADWLIALDLPMPIWDGAPGDPTGRAERATWPAHVFVDQPFTLDCWREAVDYAIAEPTC